MNRVASATERLNARKIKPSMKSIRDFIWPVIGILAVIVSCWLLYDKLHKLSIADVWDSLKAIPHHHYAAALLSTLAAYAALAWYDRIALIHLGVRNISWWYVSIASFTTYALSHNIGASVFSGALVRYRAYSAKGLSKTQIAILVGLCAFTFALGVIILTGGLLVWHPELLAQISGKLGIPAEWKHTLASSHVAVFIGGGLLAFVGLYIIGSLAHLRPLTIRRFRLAYPRPAVMLRQIIAGPLELLGAAGIIYYALPGDVNPGYIMILAVFLASFSAALLSHAPGGLGVFEGVFIAALPEVGQADLLAALIVFRLLYLLIPFALSILVVILHERSSLAAAWRRKFHAKTNSDNAA